MAKADLEYEYVVASLSVFGEDSVSVNFVQNREEPLEAAPPTGTFVPAPPVQNVGIVLSKDDARGIFPGDTYTVSFTKKN